MFSGHGGGESYLPLPEISEDLGEPAVTKFGQDRHLSLGGGGANLHPLSYEGLKIKKLKHNQLAKT